MAYHLYMQGDFYVISDSGGSEWSMVDDPVVWKHPWSENDEEPYPKAVREKYEELCGRPEFIPFDEDAACGSTDQLVEMMAGEDGCAFDQPCKFGRRVESHAVYCHNDGWLYAPRKCRRTWYTGGELRDEDCRGFKQNPQSAAILRQLSQDKR